MKNLQYISSVSGDILSIATERADYYINQNYNIDEIVSLINNSIITPRFRIFVLYNDETINYEIPIEDIKSGSGSYSENYQNGQRRSLSFALYNEHRQYSTGINGLWAGTRLRLEMGLELQNEDVIWFQKGIYIITNLSPKHSNSETIIEVSASDKFCLFENKTGTLETTYEIPVGSNIEETIKTILGGDMGNGTPFDTKEIIYNSAFKGAVTQVTISKSAGDTYGSILLELATQLSAEIFYNNMGRLTIVPIANVVDDINKPIIYDFDTRKGDVSNLDFSFDLESIVNRVIVIGSSSSGGVYQAVAVNDEPSSPLSVKRIGYRTGEIINDSNITSDILAKERADYELRQQLIIKSSSSINVSFNPLLTVNNLITITDDTYDLTKEKFLLQSISCSLGYEGTMSITISNLNNLPFLTK
mgnify:FL=1